MANDEIFSVQLKENEMLLVLKALSFVLGWTNGARQKEFKELHDRLEDIYEGRTDENG